MSREEALIGIKSRSIATRIMSLKVLRELGDLEAVRAIHRTLDDKDDRVRFLAVVALIGLNDTTGIELLVQHLASDRNSKVRSCCASALGFIPGEFSRRALLRAILDREDQVANAACIGLMRIGCRDDISSVSPLLQRRDWDIRFHACSFIIQHGDVDVEIFRAVKALAEDPEATKHDRFVTNMRRADIDEASDEPSYDGFTTTELVEKCKAMLF